MSLFDVYKKGLDVTACFMRFCKVLHIPQDNPFTPENVWEVVNLLHNKLARERETWERCQPQPDSQRLIYERIVADHQRKIQDLTDDVITRIKESCVHGKVFSIGYFQEKPSAAPALTVINPEIWPLLSIDFENSAAAGEGVGFKAIRFIGVMDLTNADRTVIEGALSARTEDVDANPVAQLEADSSNDPPSLGGPFDILKYLPSFPKKKNDWARVTEIVVEQFVSSNGCCPSEAEVWNILWSNPPGLYGINQVPADPREKGGSSSLTMGGASLNRREFKKRWNNWRGKPILSV
jgi:hypothetical protein